MPRAPRPVSGVYEKNPGSGIWYVRYRINGKLVRKKIGTRQQAIDHLDKVRFLRTTGEGIVATTAKQYTRTKQALADLGEGGITIEKLGDEYLAHIQDENNPNRPLDQENPPQRIRAIQDAFGDRPASSIKAYEISDWLKSLKRSLATLNRYRSTFSAVYRYAKERDRVKVNPVRDFSQFTVTLPKPRYLTLEEERRLRAVLQRWIDECPDHHRLTKLLLQTHPCELTVAIGTGMRKGNQYQLRWEDCDFGRKEIHLPRTKNGTSHTVPMIDDVYKTLRELQKIQKQILRIQAEGSEQTERMRLVANGRVFNISENRTWWKNALREAKIRDFSWHDLRHTFCSRLAQAGKSLKVIQEAAGHKSISMSARYAHMDQTTLRNAMSVLNRD
jgi:integrase